MRGQAWIKELRVLGLKRLLSTRTMTWQRTHVRHLLLVHREVLLVEILNARLVIFSLDHLLYSTRERPLRGSLRLGVDDLVLPSKLLALLLIAVITRAPLVLLVPLHVACDHVLL